MRELEGQEFVSMNYGLSMLQSAFAPLRSAREPAERVRTGSLKVDG